ncbi:Nickel uptake substrate-specific transmembrane region [Planctomycetes bacterium Pan216]|uniref:Nickel uptake substrate-specific transmembrane region n=1 Tax=Kolteria novifilia TaxID=2527975 RepID=A0A518AXM0_9BACT|nr:Nickel uptake substrate-specific transmembrane region [Planctomycetes bacterium Pan216]
MSAQRPSLIAATLLALALPSGAFAHSLWVEAWELGKSQEVRAGYGHPDEWEPNWEDLLKRTRFGLLLPNGTQRPLELTFDRETGMSKAMIGDERMGIVVGRVTLGLERVAGDQHVLVEQSAKAILGKPDRWSARPMAKTRFELVPSLKDGELTITAFSKGQPVEGARVVLHGPKLDEAASVTGADGKVRFPSEGMGRYAISAELTFPETGEFDGKSYSAVTETNSITFELPKGSVDRSPSSESVDPTIGN